MIWRNYLVLIGMLLLLFSVSSAYTIIDQNVIYENEYAKLNVYPHTATPTSPNQTKLVQYFIAEKKIAGTQDLWLAYKFNSSLQSGAIYELVNGEWINRTSYINIYADQNSRYYYTDVQLTFTDANPIKTWKIEYEPNENDLSKKWDLLVWKSDNITDIFSGTEDWKVVLDPWWDYGWDYNRTLIITANADVNSGLDSNKTLTLNLDTSTLISAGKMQADCDDLRILYQDTYDMNRYIVGCNQTDTNIFFRTGKVNSNWKVIPSGIDTNFSLYYGNTIATAPNIDLNQVFDDASSYYALWRLDGNYQDSVSGKTLTATGTPQADTDLYYSLSSGAYRSYASGYLSKTSLGALSSGTIEATLTIGHISGNDITMTAGAEAKRFQFSAGGTTLTGLSDAFYNTPSSFAVGETHHWAVSWDGTTHKIFWDGNQIAERTDAYTLTDGTLALYSAVTGSDSNFITVGVSSHAKTSFNFIPNKPTITLGTVTEQFTKNIVLNFFDENASTLINPTTLTLSINGSDENSWANNVVSGKLDINGSAYSSGKWVFRVGDASHPIRTFMYDINTLNLIDINFNFSLLNDVNGSSIEFTFYNQAGTSVLADANVELRDSTNRIAERKTTNSQGKITFYLNPNDSGYKFNINDVNGSDYNYTSTKITVKVPKNEETLESITPFNLTKAGAGTQDFNNLSADQNAFIYANTAQKITFTVSTDQNYFNRTYTLDSLKGQVDSYVIQPYLVSGTTGLLVWIYTINYYNNQIVPNILIKAKRDIPDQGSAVVESIKSDASGTAVFSFVSLATYSLEFYDADGLYLFSKNPFVPSATSYYSKIDVGAVDYNRTTIYPVSIVFHPVNQSLLVGSDVNIVTLGFDVNSLDSQINYINARIDLNGVNLHSVNPLTDINSGFTWYQNINITALNSSNPLNLIVTVKTSDGRTTVFNASYRFQIAESQGGEYVWDYKADFQTIGDDFGTMGKLLIIFVCVLAAVGYCAVSLTSNPSALGIIAGIVLGLFTFIGWIDGILFVFLALIGFGGFIIANKTLGG